MGGWTSISKAILAPSATWSVFPPVQYCNILSVLDLRAVAIPLRQTLELRVEGFVW